MESWREFLATKVEAIPGWLNVEAALLTAQVCAAQHAAGLRGDSLEIGVYKGKCLSVLCHASAPGERVVGIDLFIGARDPEEVARSAGASMTNVCGDAARVEILVADSLALTVPELRARAFRALLQQALRDHSGASRAVSAADARFRESLFSSSGARHYY